MLWLDKITGWLGHRRAQRLLARHATYRGIENWWQTQVGQEMQSATQKELNRILPNLFGIYLLNVGCCHDLECLNSSAIKHKLKVQPDVHVRGWGAIRAEAHTLPIASDSVDLVLLNHALGFELHPHQVLREAERVLVPEGHVVVVGFNPLSVWGIWWFLNGFRKSAPWSSNIMSQLRMKDWLKLLGFEIIQTESCFFRPHVSQSKVLSRLQFMERFGKRFLPRWGGIYVIVARKKVSCITPVGRVRTWRIPKAAPVLVSSNRGTANLEAWDLDQVG